MDEWGDDDDGGDDDDHDDDCWIHLNFSLTFLYSGSRMRLTPQKPLSSALKFF